MPTFKGLAVERIVTEATEEFSRTGRGFAVTDRVRGYWNRPRSADASVELDLVVWNRDDRVVRFGFCKRRGNKHDAQALGRFRAHDEAGHLHRLPRRFIYPRDLRHADRVCRFEAAMGKYGNRPAPAPPGAEQSGRRASPGAMRGTP
ncbi:MAG: hypothetical protein OXH99_11500 [Bryobacterales bacterium]|nr:hypothetical protein [Bryobacterales bacterium]